MKILFLIKILLIPPAIAFAQSAALVNPVIDAQFGYIKEIRSKPPGIIGTVYLYENWKNATLKIRPGNLGMDSISLIPMKFDLRLNQFEFYTRSGIKVLDAAYVERFTLYDTLNRVDDVYINCARFDFQNTRLLGFGKIIAQGKITLLKHAYIEVIKANYNVALDVGNKEDKLIKKENLYLLKDNKLFTANKKTLYNLMDDKRIEIEKYIKENGISISKESGLHLVVEDYNSIKY